MQSMRAGERRGRGGPSPSFSSSPSLLSSSPSQSLTPGPREEYLLIQELGHDLHLLPRVQQQITADAFSNEDLRTIFVTLVRVAPQCQGTIWPQLLHQIEHPGQRQIMAKMAMESFATSADERAKAVEDCLTKIQRRHMKAQRQRVINQLHTASGEAERQLLREFQRLQQKGESGVEVR
jgi:hypothetical protein